MDRGAAGGAGLTCRGLIQAIAVLNGPHAALHRAPDGPRSVRMRCREAGRGKRREGEGSGSVIAVVLEGPRRQMANHPERR